MIVLIVGDWKAHLVRGLASLAFGAAALIWPALTVVALVFLFGLYVLVDGLTMLSAYFAGDRTVHGHRRSLLIQGALGIIAGVVAFAWTGITALALLYVIAAWAITTGALEIIAAVRLHRELSNEWLLGVAGVLSVAFGLLLAIFPGEGALAITWLIGWFAAINGIAHLVFSWRLRKIQHELEGIVGPMRHAAA
jgi:uncharacterized membrane protein HdeD (DUF308 family)